MKKILVIIVCLVLFLGGLFMWFYHYGFEELLVTSKEMNLNDSEQEIRAEIGDPVYTEGDRDNIYANKILVEIADRQFIIPKAYIDTLGKRSKIEDGVVLEYILPDYEPKIKYKNLPNYREEITLKGRYAGLLLEESAVRPSFDENIKLSLEVYKPYGIGTLINKNFFGLEKYTVQNWRDYKSTTPDDTFIERGRDGSVVSYLKCSPEGKDKVPGCRHRFRDKGILYQAHWSIANLPHWEEERDEIIAFIEQFEIKDSQEK